MSAWWHRRSLRARLTLLSTALLIVGLSAGTLAIAAAFARSRIGSLDSAARSESTQLAALVSAAELPQPLPVASGQTAQVLTSAGGVLATSAAGSRTLPLVDATFVTTHADGRARTSTITAIDDDGAARVVVTRATYRGQPAFVVVAATLGDVRATEKSLRRLEFYAASLLIVVFAGLSWLLLGRALRAVAALGAAAGSVTDPNSPVRLPVPDSDDEIHGLAVTLNAMLDRLAAAALRERAFLDDAAHELRTPLASARVQLEVASLHPDDQDWPGIAATTTTDLERLGQLLDDLLALARLDSSDGNRKRLDLAVLAGVSGADPVWVLGDRAALRRTVTNLIANAERHSRSRVVVGVRVLDDVAELRVDDDGPGIALADRVRIFERFARLDDGRARDDGGTGLGLAIVAATARAHGGEAFVGESTLGGASVGIRIPLNRLGDAFPE